MMLSCYIESLLNSTERFVSLHRLYPVLDSDKTPRFYTTSRSMVFEVIHKEQLYRMTIPFGYTASELDLVKYNCNTDAPRQLRHVAKASYHPQELVVFDNDGNATHHDIIMQKISGTISLAEYLRRCIYLSDRFPIRYALRAIADLAELMEEEQISHGAISLNSIRLMEQFPHTALLLDTPLILHKSLKRDMLSLGRMATMLYLIGGCPRLFPMLGGLDVCSVHRFFEVARYILAAAQFYNMAPLVNLLKQMDDDPTDGVCSAIGLLCDTPFVKDMSLLEKLLMECCDAKPEEFDHDYGSEEPIKCDDTEDSTARVEWEKCSFVGRTCHNLIRFKLGDFWGFADKEGVCLPLRGILYAEDFYEGRAVVKTSKGYGLIDSDGHFVIKPMFEYLFWWGHENAVSACVGGKWNLLDRSGVVMTSRSYDHMGSFNEGLMAVGVKDKYGFLDKDGKIAIPLVYDSVNDFSGGVASVIYKGGEFTIDKNGTRLKKTL